MDGYVRGAGAQKGWDAEEEFRTVRILAISGSLRAASSNTALLRTVGALAPEGVEVVLYDGLAGLPHFNPEYAHGVPGTLKNALDRVVSSGDIYEKLVALINASMGATHAYTSLMETLTTADADIVREASVRVGLPSNRMGEAGIVSNPELSGALRSAIFAFARAIETRRAEADEWSR